MAAESVGLYFASGLTGLGRSHKFWTVLKTKQSSSSDARANLRNQAFEFFHPMFRERAVRGVRKVAALFPYYLMVRVDERKQDWRVLCSTKGVSYLLMDGDRPGMVSDVFVSDLRTLVDDTEDGYYHDHRCDHPSFTPGQSVAGLRGLFEGKYGVYRGLEGNHAARVRVLFNILGRETEFVVRADDLAAVAAA